MQTQSLKNLVVSQFESALCIIWRNQTTLGAAAVFGILLDMIKVPVFSRLGIS